MELNSIARLIARTETTTQNFKSQTKIWKFETGLKFSDYIKMRRNI